MKTFNTVTFYEVTNNFEKSGKFRAVYNDGPHEHHVTDIIEADSMKLVKKWAKENWPTAEFINGGII